MWALPVPVLTVVTEESLEREVALDVVGVILCGRGVLVNLSNVDLELRRLYDMFSPASLIVIESLFRFVAIGPEELAI